MAADTPDDSISPPKPPLPVTERDLREAEDLALAASGLGSGLLKQQPTREDTIAVLKICPQCGTEYETAARFCPKDGTSLRPKGTDTLIDRVLAERYHILKRIGEGGMGRVYLGEHVKMNRQCAIKVMSPSLVNDHESATRFAREASSAARIIHPNVAAVFDYGESEGLVYLVMEYVDGEPLSRILSREAPLSVDRATDLARQIADGLGAAHELGIVHRDLKPDNILVARTRTGREVAKVVDFGIAKAMQESVGEALTRSGLVIGTPEFMSPEQLLGDPIDARSDLYALGCILYMMLTATAPFAASTREQMIKRRLAESAPHIQKVDPGLPVSLDRIVEKLLARSPAERYGSAAEVRDALGGTHPRLSVESDPNEWLTPRSAPTIAFESVANATTEMSAAPVAPPALRMRARRRGPVLLVAGIIVLLGGAFARSQWRRDRESHPSPATPRVDGSAPRPVSPVATAPPTLAATKRIAIVDTAKARKQRAARRLRDSLARVEHAVPIPLRAALNSYARAVESGDVAKIKQIYPTMTGAQEDYWKSFFGGAERITTTVRYGKGSVRDNSAGGDFSLRIKYIYKASKSIGNNVAQPQHITLSKQPDGRWLITEVTEVR